MPVRTLSVFLPRLRRPLRQGGELAGTAAAAGRGCRDAAPERRRGGLRYGRRGRGRRRSRRRLGLQFEGTYRL